MLSRLARVAVQVRKRYDRRVNPAAQISVHSPDITERDNATLALAVSRIQPALADLYDRRLIGEQELLRLVYRMAAETFDPADCPRAGRAPSSLPGPASRSEGRRTGPRRTRRPR